MTRNGPHSKNLWVGLYATYKFGSNTNALEVYGYDPSVFL